MTISPRIFKSIPRSDIARLTLGSILLVALATAVATSADVTLRKIGNPVFEPTDFAFGSARLHRNHNNTASDFFEAQDEWISGVLNGAYVLDGDLKEEYPGGSPLFPVASPFDSDNILRNAMASDGGLLSDIVTVNQVRGRNFYSLNFTLVPTQDAPSSVNAEGESSPILPDDVFPITHDSDFFTNGEPLSLTRTPRPPIEAIASYGVVMGDDGIARDYSDSHWDHRIMRVFHGNTSTRPSSEIVGDWEYVAEVRDRNGNGWDITASWEVVPRRSRLLGDLSHDEELDSYDLKILTQNVAAGTTNSLLDLNDDDVVDLGDVEYWVTELKQTAMGDTNLDGAVDFEDFLALSENFGESGTWENGDFNANEMVEFDDFLLLGENFGSSSQTMAAAVPEPSAVCMIFVATLGLFGLRRRLRSV